MCLHLKGIPSSSIIPSSKVSSLECTYLGLCSFETNFFGAFPRYLIRSSYIGTLDTLVFTDNQNCEILKKKQM